MYEGKDISEECISKKLVMTGMRGSCFPTSMSKI